MSREARVTVKINSAELTGDTSDDILSLSYTDNASEDADDISVSIQNRTKKWLRKWLPQEGATISAILTAWTGKLNCGKFIIDDVGMSGWPLVVDIKGVAMPVDTDFSGVEKNKTWSKATIKEIASYIANNSKIPLLYDAKYNPVISFVSQSKKSDKEFLYEFCAKYGLTLKLFSNKIVIYDMVEKELKKAITTLYESDMEDGFDAHSTISDTGYSACVVKYTDASGKTLEYPYEIKGKTKKIYKHTEKVNSLAEAQRIARAKLRELNMAETTFNCTVMGNTRLVAAVCVKIKGFGNFDGKYFIDKATHEKSGSGKYTTKLEMHKVMNYA